jgi:hypothetical protein
MWISILRGLIKAMSPVEGRLKVRLGYPWRIEEMKVFGGIEVL